MTCSKGSDKCFEFRRSNVKAFQNQAHARVKPVQGHVCDCVSESRRAAFLTSLAASTPSHFLSFLVTEVRFALLLHSCIYLRKWKAPMLPADLAGSWIRLQGGPKPCHSTSREILLLQPTENDKLAYKHISICKWSIPHSSLERSTEGEDQL